jgi:biopolymer transport protein ExbB
MGWFLNGGFMMWPLLLLSILTLAVVIERVRFLRRQRDLPARAAIEDALRRLALAERDGPAIEAAILAEQRRLERGLFWLDTAITAAPMMGILGTVLGIIQAFAVIADKNSADPLAVSGGVAQALITTAAGLVIALAALFPYNWLRAAIEARLEDLEREGRRLLSGRI